ncbi:NrdH-redoxin [Candidatus Wolfebacteria bacterium RIFCSPHIGHO2_01_FULL_48_22]|uniref:NrdH-redoxin n=2 Tax=Candidatus Wolfeibacteriota TaxID=1752735 RepID=A0A1F8DVA9_9BACT|nr:MAG: NrdH-redoxin [Candidatus Wolfebacteria bacterium RIFCSPHIGHO2_01_FULL_48_22]OGM93929.1 MAG: NrdH-redoxin [Candidatus Wolfebacteria bacterium RIFCSPLOWO2_01_FULL_47_17b]
MVTIYSTTHCPYCKMAKDYFTQHNVEYKDINVEQDDAAAADMIKKSGQMGVPVIDIDGTIIVGFDRGSIDEILHLQ